MDGEVDLRLGIWHDLGDGVRIKLHEVVSVGKNGPGRVRIVVDAPKSVSIRRGEQERRNAEGDATKAKRPSA